MGYFFALDIPDNIAEAVGQIHLDGEGVRNQRRSDMHITIAHMGDLDDGQVEALLAQTRQLKTSETFNLSVQGVFYFPPQHGYRGHFYGASIIKSDHLIQLKRKIDDLIDGLGLENYRGLGGFKPHITLFRSENPPKRDHLDDFMRKYADFSAETFKVRGFSLYKSNFPDPYIKIAQFDFKK